MTLRDVKPFNARQWKQLEESIKNGPTEQQKKTLKEAEERIKGIKIEF